jgi:hypothetical protein
MSEAVDNTHEDIIPAGKQELLGELIAPQEILAQASEKAKALQDVIRQSNKPPLKFNGKDYLEYQHWQTVGGFYGVGVLTHDPEPVTIGGVEGFKAKATLLDKAGLKVGSAEAYCMRDEPNWQNKPLFQLASMAQTRAGSKALSNRFRWVAVLAGYEGTPAEEMADVGNRVEVRPQAVRPAPVAEAFKGEVVTYPSWESLPQEIKTEAGRGRMQLMKYLGIRVGPAGPNGKRLLEWDGNPRSPQSAQGFLEESLVAATGHRNSFWVRSIQDALRCSEDIEKYIADLEKLG